MEVSNTYIANNQEEITSAYEKHLEVYDQMVADYEAQLAEQRKAQGVAKINAGNVVADGMPANVGGGVTSSTYSVGDATFMDPDDSFLRYIQNRTDVDANGYYDIIAHGTPNGMQITHNGQHIIVDHRTVAKLIQNANGYNGQGIRLLSCNTGTLDNGFAQNLSNQLNVEVYAPTNYLWATQDGSYFVAGMTNQGGPNMSDIGSFRVFIPGGNR